MAAPKNQFQITGTPDPNEEAFFTDLNQEALKNLRTDQWPRTADAGGTATIYQDWNLSLPERVQQGWGNYVYTKKRPLGEGVIRFFWAKNKTEAEINSPFKTTPTMGNHYWGPILLDIEITKSKIPRAVDTGDRIYRGFTYKAIPIWIPSADTGTLFILREFTAPAKFDIPQWPTPILTPVNFAVPGSRDFSFPESYHGDLPIKEMEDSSSSYDPVSVAVSSNVGLTTPWFFPATPFKTWGTFILYDRQSQDEESGVWHRLQMEVNPPNLPKRQRGLS